jgi:hypothetical protein
MYASNIVRHVSVAIRRPWFNGHVALSREYRRPMHRFERHMQAKGHYPTFSRRGIRVTVSPSYITIHKKLAATYIPRETLIPLLRWLVPLVRQMEGDFDPDEAMSAYLAQEAEFDAELREQKRQRRRPKRS